MFVDFDLGPEDYIELKTNNNDSNSQLYAINTTPRVNYWRIANGESLWVQFVTHMHYTFRGFQIEFKFLEKKKGDYFYMIAKHADH